ncbi:hypothetical protein GCM10011608_47390 [Micromonospora sonchi]|uniref:Uncharacterized protein n=1 Tax=Micromonospora sonchi TaxID=1763543 RepID=A0A917X173_9ACTN|nr:hypothetical protein [Micromonospora sonchi]GGM57066.1 hypothetical protein GCM10011608_47390 [Micromonospora sonchi]
MSARLLRLHLTARGVPKFAVGLAVVTVLAWSAGSWLASRSYFNGALARVPVVALAPLLAAILVAPTLGGADDDLERSTPLRWRAWRAGHVLLAGLAIAAALSLAGLREPHAFGAYALVRNTLGCTGLVAGAAALLGVRLAWLPAFGYVCAVYAAVPRQTDPATALWAWPVQPSTSATSWLPVVALFGLGVAAYARFGPGPAMAAHPSV